MQLDNSKTWRNLRRWADETVAEAIGTVSRHDPVLPHSGGPAGNAMLTAWTGLVLLVAFAVEVGTLLDLGRFLSWHIVVGVVLIPLVVLKTASTGWRILGYYTGRAPYHRAGPPPMLLRLLGPLVILLTFSVLGSGLSLVALGPRLSREAILTVAGFRLDAIFVHQAAVAGWAVVIGLHVAGRLLPAARIVTAPVREDQHVPGTVPRLVVLIAVLLVAAVTAAFVFGLAGPWISGGLHFHHR